MWDDMLLESCSTGDQTLFEQTLSAVLFSSIFEQNVIDLLYFSPVLSRFSFKPLH